MAINKVGSKGITDGAVASADFKDGDITSAKIGDSQITNAKLSNTSFTLAGQSVSLGGSVSLNTTDWQSVITADGSTTTTAVAGQGYFIDTTSAAHTINLPASASIGDFIAIKDYAGTFATNNLTIARNGHNIQGVANDSLISTNRASLVLVYVDSTKGWLYWQEHNVQYFTKYITATGGTITTSGDYKIHSFTGDGCFVVSCAGSTGFSNNVDYLVVAGGGGGGGAQHGGNQRSGGGGAGGYRESHSTPVSGCYTASPLATPTGITISATTYPVTVGAGGSGNYNGRSNGSNSVFSTITSTGGGYGGEVRIGAPADNPSPGGSGGGASASSAIVGSGNTPPVSPPQGNNGGSSTGYNAEGGGGGGAIEAGNTDGQATGGDGASSEISGSPTIYAGGGGGNFQPGGCGGGGNSAPPCGPVVGGSGTANTGGGGGAGRGNPSSPTGGGSGGKGIVIIRYKYQ